MKRAHDLIKLHGVAIRYEEDRDGYGAWVAAFHFAGPDIVAQGKTMQAALDNFQVAIMLEGAEAGANE